MKDIRKEIATRKFKSQNRFLYWIYRTVMKIVGRRYNAHFEVVDDINKCDGPAIVIFNHLSRIDHFYTNEICYPRRVNMVAGYNEFFRSHLHFAFKMNRVIPKKQYINDFIGTKGIMSVIKQGGCVSFAPEGLATNDGTPKPIVPHTGALLKKLGVLVYHVKLSGQYLQNTKVCLDVREGETYAKIYILFTKEDLERLTVDEIDDKINEAFRHDEYEWQKEKHIKWNMHDNAAYHLDHLCYRCPKCHHEFEMVAEGDTLYCANCGNGTKINEYYEFVPFEGSIIPESPSKWADYERREIIKAIRKDPNYSITEHVKVGILPNDHLVKDHKTSEIVGEGMLTIDHNGMRYKGSNTDKYDFDLNYKELYTLFTELDSSIMNLYVKGEYYDVIPDTPITLKATMLVEEMHRLHVNTYKNFKWKDYLYENLDEEEK